jgi:hypothetical protein
MEMDGDWKMEGKCPEAKAIIYSNWGTSMGLILIKSPLPPHCNT